MNKQFAQKICHIYALGNLIEQPNAIKGSLLNQIWQFTTTQGVYAVKVLNPAVGDDHASLLKKYLLGEKIAEIVADHHIPALTALKIYNNSFVELEKSYIMLFPWIDGYTLPARAVLPSYAQQIGAWLAKIHALKLNFPELKTMEHNPLATCDLAALVAKIGDHPLVIGINKNNLLTKLQAWKQNYFTAAPQLQHHLIVSHTDLHQKNVIWKDANSPILIDWEYVNFINPEVDLIDTALNWSGITTGKIQKTVFQAVLEGYLTTGGTITLPATILLDGFLKSPLNWLIFNIQRSLGKHIRNQKDIALGKRETRKTLRALCCLEKNKSLLVDVITKIANDKK